MQSRDLDISDQLELIVETMSDETFGLFIRDISERTRDMCFMREDRRGEEVKKMKLVDLSEEILLVKSAVIRQGFNESVARRKRWNERSKREFTLAKKNLGKLSREEIFESKKGNLNDDRHHPSDDDIVDDDEDTGSQLQKADGTHGKSEENVSTPLSVQSRQDVGKRI